MGAEFEIGETTEGGRPVLHLRGELDVSTVTGVRQRLEPLFASREVILDLSEITFLDASGIGLLVDSTQQADANGCRLVLRGAKARIRAILRISGALDGLRFE